MSQVSWYPENPRSRRDFFLRSFPIFVVLVIFLYFGLDWLGAFEFLELLVRENSAWLMKVIFGVGYDEFTQFYHDRIDANPFGGLSVQFGELFPAIRISGYPKVLLIIRACTGMEAGALLIALILVTPAKWYNKAIANVVNLLMMHIGNTFRVAFHFWFTKYLFEGGMNADKAFFWAHDMLSKVFGFVGIVIFTLVIERTGVKIVSTFGAWMDAAGEGFKRIGWKVQKIAFYNRKIQSEEDQSNLEVESGEIEQIKIEKIFFYPKQEIDENKWSFFQKSFTTFIVTSAILLSIGLIPQVSQLIASASDSIAINWFGAVRTEFEKINSLWYYSKFQNAPGVIFTVNMFATGLGLAAFVIGMIIATPGDTRKKILMSCITFFTVIPLQILMLGIRKGLTWSVANNFDFKSNRPLLFINTGELIITWLPIFTWIIGFILLMIIAYYLDVKAIATVFAWLHQLSILFLQIVGLRKKTKEDEIFSEEVEAEASQ